MKVQNGTIEISQNPDKDEPFILDAAQKFEGSHRLERARLFMTERQLRLLIRRCEQALLASILLMIVGSVPALAQQFNPAAFNWTDPANWDIRQDAGGVERWTLRDPAARAYNQQARRAGRLCVASFYRGRRHINLMIPAGSPQCPR